MKNKERWKRRIFQLWEDSEIDEPDDVTVSTGIVTTF